MTLYLNLEFDIPIEYHCLNILYFLREFLKTFKYGFHEVSIVTWFPPDILSSQRSGLPKNSSRVIRVLKGSGYEK